MDFIDCKLNFLNIIIDANFIVNIEIIIYILNIELYIECNL